MSQLWNWCAFCGKRIETGEKCYGLPSGESVCTDCCVAENDMVMESGKRTEYVTPAVGRYGFRERHTEKPERRADNG